MIPSKFILLHPRITTQLLAHSTSFRRRFPELQKRTEVKRNPDMKTALHTFTQANSKVPEKDEKEDKSKNHMLRVRKTRPRSKDLVVQFAALT